MSDHYRTDHKVSPFKALHCWAYKMRAPGRCLIFALTIFFLPACAIFGLGPRVDFTKYVDEITWDEAGNLYFLYRNGDYSTNGVKIVLCRWSMDNRVVSLENIISVPSAPDISRIESFDLQQDNIIFSFGSETWTYALASGVRTYLDIDEANTGGVAWANNGDLFLMEKTGDPSSENGRYGTFRLVRTDASGVNRKLLADGPFVPWMKVSPNRSKVLTRNSREKNWVVVDMDGNSQTIPTPFFPSGSGDVPNSFVFGWVTDQSLLVGEG